MEPAQRAPLGLRWSGRRSTKFVRPCALLLVVDVPIADMGPSANSHIKAASLASGAAGHDGSDRFARSLKERPRSSSRSG